MLCMIVVRLIDAEVSLRCAGEEKRRLRFNMADQVSNAGDLNPTGTCRFGGMENREIPKISLLGGARLELAVVKFGIDNSLA